MHPWDVHPLIPKWLHTVLEEHDFVSEWAAIDKAQCLAKSVHACQQVQRSHWTSFPKPTKPECTVRFASDISLIIGQHDCCEFFEVVMPETALSGHDKPWTTVHTPPIQHHEHRSSNSFDRNPKLYHEPAKRANEYAANASSQSPFDCARHYAQIEKVDSPTDRIAEKVDKVDSIPMFPKEFKFLYSQGAERSFSTTDLMNEFPSQHPAKDNTSKAWHVCTEAPGIDQTSRTKCLDTTLPSDQQDKSGIALEFYDACKKTNASSQELHRTSPQPLSNTNRQNFHCTTSSCCAAIRCTDPLVLQSVDVQHVPGYTDENRVASVLPNGPSNVRVSQVNPSRMQSDPSTCCSQVTENTISSKDAHGHSSSQKVEVHASMANHCMSQDTMSIFCQSLQDIQTQISSSWTYKHDEAYWSRCLSRHRKHSHQRCPEFDVQNRSQNLDSNVSTPNWRQASHRVPFNHLRLEHESPIAHLRDQGQASDSDGDSDGESDEQEPATPRFVDELTSRIRRAGLNPYDPDFEIAVRTWFIDHAVIHRWTAPRLLQLVGPPHTWHTQITSIWIDQINPDDWFDVAIVAPDPPRPSEHSYVVFDLIGVQSVTFPRVAALVTVIPGHHAMFSMFTVACSLPETVSGYELIQSADAGQNCRQRRCIITHRLNQIPNYMRPMHQVGHGDSYQIAVHPLPPSQQSNIEPHSESASSSTGPIIARQEIAQPTDNPDEQPDASNANEVHGPVERFLFATVMHLFQYQGPEVIVELVNQQIIQPTQNIADSLGVPFDTLEALHVMPIHPNGIPDYHSAAVVQRVGDVPIRSTDRLLLLDIEYHHHATDAQTRTDPTVVREVIRTAFLVTRYQILMSAGVYHYCQMLQSNQDTCTVHLNGLPWMIEDVAPRPIQHGSYAHIRIPPPPGHDVPTDTAARVIQEVNERPHEFAAEIDELLQSDDDASLAQVSTRLNPATYPVQENMPHPAGMQNEGFFSQQRTRKAAFAHNEASLTHAPVKSRPIWTHRTYNCPKPHVHQARLEHESPLDQLPDSQRPQQEDQPEDPPPGPDRPELPAFAISLANRMTQIGVDPLADDFELPLRTWYIAHDTVHRWTAPRILRLVGPPIGWEQQIRIMWIDQLDPTQWFAVTVVEPDPPRPIQHGQVVYDVIIEQALDLPRFAGLVTVLPEQPHRFQFYSVACSLPGRVSGYDLIQAADAGTYCQYQSCTITYRWNEIPNTLRPHHEVGHGDSFQIVVNSGDDALARSASTLSQLTARSPSTAPSSNSASLPSMTNAEPLIPQPTNPYVTVAHLHTLQGAQTSVELINGQELLPTQVIANGLGIPLDQLEALHTVPFQLTAVPQSEIVAIAQQVGDLPLGAMDRLLIVDTVLHHSVSPGHANSPTVLRIVRRVGHVIIRDQLLLQAELPHMSHTMAATSTVWLDAVLWPEDDFAPRIVRTGSFAQVVVAPVEEGTNQTASSNDVEGQHNASSSTHPLQTSTLQEDDASLIQHTGGLHTLRHSPHLLPVDMDQCKSGRDEQDTPLGQTDPNPTVVQFTSDLNSRNPQTYKEACPAPPDAEKERMTRSSTAPLPHAQKARQRGRRASPKRTLEDSAKENANTQRQTTIRDFFSKAGKRQTLVELPQQSKISDFFKPQSLPMACSHKGTDKNQTEGKPKTLNLPSENAFPDQINAKSLQTSQKIVQNKCNEDQVILAPQFTRNIPLPPQPGQRTQARPIWQIELNNAFDELAVTTHAVTGPELVVEVWYIHHLSYPECPASRVVRLDGVTELWYADLCTAWWDKIERAEPLKVLIVKPPPPHQVRPESRLHIILEQGRQPRSAALLFTAFFHGDTRDGLLQQAESVPDAICTKDMIDKHNFQVFCQFRPCRMFF